MTPQALALLHAACFDTPRPWSAAEFGSLLGGSGTFLVGGPTGFALGRALAGEAELLTLAVDPGLRRQGLGRSLLLAFEAGARARGAQTAFLEVAADNAPACALYRQAGYARVGQRRAYYRRSDGQAVDALVMRRALAQD